jgi:3-oxoacyl-[acyl-carrier-protein] synthase II
MYGAAASQLAARFQGNGPNLTVSTACSSGANAIGLAMMLIRYGHASCMLAGGADAPVTPLVMAAWDSMRALSTQNAEPARACKPFSRNRDGFVLSEGATFLLLEDWDLAVSRGARIYAELAGYGTSADAGHLTAPCAAGEALAIRRALDDAGLEPAAVDYINAHGTATRWNDVTETTAIKQSLNDYAYSVPISSIKGAVGHSMGAAGALECLAATLTLHHRIVVPTLNYEERDPQCDLDYVPGAARAVPADARLDVAISNSFGFGGNNAVLALRRSDGRASGRAALPGEYR